MTPEFINQFSENKRIWALGAYVNASRVLIRAKNIENLINGVCEGVANQQPYVLACVGLNELLPSKKINIVGKAGSAKAYAENLDLSWDENSPFGKGPTGTAIRNKQPVIMDDSELNPNYEAWIEKARANKIRSTISIPLYEEDSVMGTFAVYASEPNAFGEAETRLFEILAEELSYGIKNIRQQQKVG